MKNRNYILYIIVLVITLGLFGTAMYVSNYINVRKTNELKSIEDKIALDLLTTETLLNSPNEAACSTFKSSDLRQELDSLAERLSFMEDQVGKDNQDIYRLKRYYTQLQIRDYLLSKKMSQLCHFNSVFMLYFYPSKTECPQCNVQQYILRALTERYNQLEVYQFDFDVDSENIKFSIPVDFVPARPPFFYINGKLFVPFKNLDEATAAIDSFIATSSATTTKKK